MIIIKSNSLAAAAHILREETGRALIMLIDTKQTRIELQYAASMSEHLLSRHTKRDIHTKDHRTFLQKTRT